MRTAKASEIKPPPGLAHRNAFQALHVNSEDDDVKNFMEKGRFDVDTYDENFPGDIVKEQAQKKKIQPMGNYSKKSQRDRKVDLKAGAKHNQVIKPNKTLNLFQKIPVVKELSPVITEKSDMSGWMCIKGVMDSGASESVAPPSMCPEVEVTPSVGSKAGQNYISASDDLLPNLGEQLIDVVTDDGRDGRVRYQIAEVTRPLNSVSEICDAGGELGQQVTFGRHGGSILNLETGMVTNFKREDGIYILDMWVRPKTNNATGFPRQS